VRRVERSAEETDLEARHTGSISLFAPHCEWYTPRHSTFQVTYEPDS